MAESRVKLVIDSQEFDAKLKTASQNLQAYFDKVKEGGGSFEHLDDGVMDCAKALGELATKAKSTKGGISELTASFTEWSMRYKQMTDAEKNTPFGKQIRSSLDQLKTRIQETKKDLQDINQELSGSKFGQFGGVIDTIGHKMGLTANATELLTSKTALMYAGIGAGIAIVGKASDAWAKYNSELSKQDQITTVTTGLKGTEADKMTDTMRALSDTYKVDFREAINAANTLMSQFGVNGDEAIQLIKDGMQGMIQGDGPKLLQMIKQYAPAFRDAGVSASQLVAVIHNSEGGIFTDQNMNAIVMGMKNIRLMTKQTSDALSQLGIDGKKMSQDLNAGTITVFDALKQVAGELKNVDSNSQAAGEVMQAVFGRQGVTAGTNIAKVIETLNTNLEETKKQTGELGDAFAELQTANEHLNTAIREAFSYDGWAEMATGIKSTLIDTLADVIDQLGTIKGLLAGLTPGQAKSERYGTTGTPDEVKRDLEALSKADADTREAMYQGMLQKYEKRFAEVTNKMQSAQRYFDHYNNMGWVGEGFPVLNKGMNMWYASTKVNTARSNVAAEQDVLSTFRKEAAKILNPQQTPPPNNNNNNNNNNNGSGTKLTDQQKAQAKFDQAEKDYQQALEAAALAVKSGQADTVAAKKKELSAAESLWKAIGDAREVYDSDAFKTAQEDAAKKVVELGGSVNALVEEQKKAQEAARKLTAAQEKAATAYQQMQVAQANNDLKAYNTALKQYQTAQADVQRLQASIPELPKLQGGKVVYTVEVNDEQLAKLKALPKDDDTIRLNVEEGEVNLPLVPKDDQTIRFNVEQGDVDLPELPDKTYTVTIEAATEAAAVKVDELVEGMNAEKVTIPVEVEQPKPQGGKVVYTVEVNDEQLAKLKALPKDDDTIRLNVEEGEVNLPLVPKDDQTIRFNVEQGDVDLPELPEKTYTVTIEAATEAAAVKVDELVEGMNAEKVTIPVTVEQPNPVQVPVEMSYTENNMSAFLATLKEKIAQEDVGSTLYNNLTAQLADANALANLMQTAIKNGIDISQFNPQDLWKKVFGENPGDYISDAQLGEIRKKIEEIIGKPIKLDVNTGNINGEGSGGSSSKETGSKYISQISGGISSMTSSIEQLGIQVPEGLKAVVGGIQAVTSILTTISTIMSSIEAFSAAGSIPFFSNGGIIPYAANGYFVPGTHYSGDTTPIMANAGELVLNTSSQQSLASDIINAQNLISSIYDLYNFEHSVLGSSQQADLAGQIGGNTQHGGGGHTFVSGEQIFLAVNNYLRRSGYGEIVTSRR